MAQLKASPTKKRNKDVMCKEEEFEFSRIKKARDTNMQNLKDGKITQKEFEANCANLIKKLDALKAKYD